MFDRLCRSNRDNLLPQCGCSVQRHVHEFLCSTKISNSSDGVHNHRFCGVSEQASPCSGSHVHKLKCNTDYFDGHFHTVCVVTGPAINVGEGRHIHFVDANTSVEECHHHEFLCGTLIENPIGD